MLARRELLAGGAALAVARPRIGAGDAPALGSHAQVAWAALDLGSGRTLGHAPGRQMPMCSSFKWLLAAFVLARADRGEEDLDREIAFGPADLLPASPTTSAALEMAGGRRVGMSVGALCAAITAVSDNAAANLLLRAVGGPAALTRWLRSAGDAVTSCDRFEPENNRVPKGDPRDTTTPAAAVEDLRRLLYGDVLSARWRERLTGWMLGCRVGDARLKAGLPAGWRIAHRTGTRDFDAADSAAGPRAAAVDLGALIPPAGPPILLAAFAAGWTVPLDRVEPWFAGIARDAVARLRG